MGRIDGRKRGAGSLYLRSGKTFWARWVDNGRTYRESTQTDDQDSALRFLDRRKREVAASEHAEAISSEATVHVERLLRIMLGDYALNERKSTTRVVRTFDYLMAIVSPECNAENVTFEHLQNFATERLKTASRGTVRLELSILHRAFFLAKQCGVIKEIPAFPQIKPSPARRGFFEPRELRAILRQVGDDYKPILEFLNLTGWRCGEARNLQWKDVDMNRCTIRIWSGESKNEEPRVLPFGRYKDLKSLMDTQKRRADAIALLHSIVPTYVFCRVDGREIKEQSLRGSWSRARIKAGYPAKLIHDLRRTAVRRMERAGVPRSVAMQITGHRTESIYARYAISNERDISDGLARVSDLLEDEMRTSSTL